MSVSLCTAECVCVCVCAVQTWIRSSLCVTVLAGRRGLSSPLRDGISPHRREASRNAAPRVPLIRQFKGLTAQRAPARHRA